MDSQINTGPVESNYPAAQKFVSNSFLKLINKHIQNNNDSEDKYFLN